MSETLDLFAALPEVEAEPSIDLCARQIVVASLLYYGHDHTFMPDSEFDQMCQRVAEQRSKPLTPSGRSCWGRPARSGRAASTSRSPSSPRGRRTNRCGSCERSLSAGASRSAGHNAGLRNVEKIKCLILLVGVAGFEPATPASRTQCSTGLSHTPTKNAAYSLGFR